MTHGDTLNNEPWVVDTKAAEGTAVLVWMVPFSREPTSCYGCSNRSFYIEVKYLKTSNCTFFLQTLLVCHKKIRH